MSTRLALFLLAALSLYLAHRSPRWRPFAASLCMLAAIDVARLWTAGHGAVRERGWWQADVMLCALWPVAIGVGLLRNEHTQRAVECPAGEAIRGRVDDIAQRANEATNQITDHMPTIARLAALCSISFLLGALRPYLPRLLYLTGLRLPRWALAGLWVEALGVVAFRATTEDKAPLVCPLLLAALNTADLLAGAWACPPWEAPSWEYARACTWVAYVAVGVVMGWEAVRSREARNR